MNEIAALAIAALWVTTGRELNLCFVVLCYYIIFIFTESFTLPVIDLSNLSDVTFYYVSQAWLDVSIIMACLLISSKYKRIIILSRVYAAIIATSLMCDTMMIVNTSLNIEFFYQLHEARQYFSIPLDVLFAILGSGLYERLSANSGLRPR